MALSSSATLTAFAMTQQRLLHTYVTSSCGASWECWGGKTGGLGIINGPGSSISADCISKPNVGTGLLSFGLAGIVYGVNGVCHHMANRILSAANIELPLSYAQIRLSRLTYSGGTFGRNIPGQPIDDRWPDRQVGCKSQRSADSVGASDVSGDLSFSSGSGLMSFRGGAHEDPDPRAELFALIEAASLGHPVEQQKLEALLKIQEDLRTGQEQLARWLLEKEITRTQYIAKLDTVMSEAARAGEKVLGFSDFHKVFGEFSVQSILDVDAFVGAWNGGGFLTR